jgi:hypothetical protein
MSIIAILFIVALVPLLVVGRIVVLPRVRERAGIEKDAPSTQPEPDPSEADEAPTIRALRRALHHRRKNHRA